MQVSRLIRIIAILLLLSALPMSGVCAPTGTDSSGTQGGGRARRPITHERPTVYFKIAPTWSFTGGGYYYNGVRSVFGYSVSLSLRVSRALAIRFDYSKAGYRCDANTSRHNIWKSITVGRLTLNALRYTMSLEYTRIMNPRARNLKMYYVYAGLGTIDHTFRAEALRYPFKDLEAGDSDEYSESYLVAVGGVGARVMISDHLGFDAGGAVHVIFLGRYAAKPGDPPDHHYGTNIDSWVGLVVVL